MSGEQRPNGPAAVEVSVVAPVFNEEETVVPLVEAIAGVLDGIGRSSEILIVDDGSSDSTTAKLLELRRQHATLRVVRMKRNFGQTLAMQAGFDATRGRIVITMDGDLQNDPADVPKLLQKMDEGYDVVSGWRKKRKDNPILRTFPSRVANWIIGRLTGVHLHDSGCSLKAYRASHLKRVRLYADMHRFIPAMVSTSGARVAEVVVNHRPRVAGESKYGMSRIVKVALDLLIIKMITGFGERPGRYFAMLGLPWFALSALFVWVGIAAGAGRTTIVLPAAGLLLAWLGFHFLVFSLVGELALHSGSLAPSRVVEEQEL